MRLFRRIIISSFTTVVFAGTLAFAVQEGAQTFTLDGRLYDSALPTNPLLDSSVDLKIQILSANKACLLYEEHQLVNTTSSNGYFNIQVGSATGNAKRTASDPGNSMASVFQNIMPITANNAGCTGGSTPSSGDPRYFRIIVTPSSTAVASTLAPDMTLDAVPAAMVAETVSGLGKSDLLVVKDDASTLLNQTNLNDVFSAINYPKLNALLGGTSNLYIASSTTNGAKLPVLSSAPSSPTTGTFWYDSVSNTLKYYNGSSTQTLGTSGAGLSSITVGADLTADGTAGGTLSAPGTIGLGTTGVSAGSYAKVTVDTKGRVTAGGTLSASDLPSGGYDSAYFKQNGNAFAGTAVLGTTDNNALQFKTNNAAAMTVLSGGNVGIGTTSPARSLSVKSASNPVIADFTAANGALLDLISQAGTQGAALRFLGPSGAWTAGVDSSITGSPFVIAGGYDVPENIPSSSKFLTITGTGSVGIGTTAPTANLQIVGSSPVLKITANSTPSEIAITNGSGVFNMLSMGRGNSESYVQSDIQLNFYAGTTSHASPNMTIAASGYVGVGTSTPASYLDVKGGTATANTHALDAIIRGQDATGSNGYNGGGLTVISGAPTAFGVGGGISLSNGTQKLVNLYNDSGHGHFSVNDSNGVAYASFYATGTGYSKGAFTFGSSNAPLSMLDVYGSVAIGSGYATSQAAPANGAIIQGSVGIGTTSPTARLHLATSSGAASSAPLKFTSGTLLSSVENGAMEFDGTDYYLTAAGSRRKIAGTSATGDFTGVGSVTGSGALAISSGGSNNNLTLTATGTTSSIVLNPGSTSGQVQANGSVYVNNSTASTSPTTGALTVNGGVGIGADLHVAGKITTGSSGKVGSLDLYANDGVFQGSLSASSGEIQNFLNGSSIHYSIVAAGTGEILRVTGTGRVGIGTNNPLYNLHVVSATGADQVATFQAPTGRTSYLGTAVSGGATTAMAAGSAGGWLGTSSNHDFFLQTNAIDRLHIDTAGRVGIGTTGPSVLLNVVGSDTWNSEVRLENQSSTSFINPSFSAYNWASTFGGYPTVGLFNSRGSKASPAAVQSGDTLGTFSAFGYDGSSNGFASSMAMVAAENYSGTGHGAHMTFSTVDIGSTSANERMRITSSGNVGIGSTSPTGTLDVQGGTAAAAASGTNIHLTAQNGGTGNTNGGNIFLNPGAAAGTGTPGRVGININWTPNAVLNSYNLVTSPSGGLPSMMGESYFNPSSAAAANATVFGGQFLTTTQGTADMTNANVAGSYNYVNHAVNQPLGQANGTWGFVSNTGTNALSLANGSYFYVQNASTGSIGTANGFIGNVLNSGTGTITTATGIAGGVQLTAAGTITTAYGLSSGVTKSAGTIGTAIGLYIGPVQGTNHWGVYQNDTSNNYFGGSVGIGVTNPSYTLDVNGNARATGSIAAWSDARVKKNIQPIDDGLGKILNLNGVSFDWRRDEFPEKNFKEGRDIGVIAQNVETQFPEIVETGKDGYKSVAYQKLVAPLIESVKSLYRRLVGIETTQATQARDIASKADRTETDALRAENAHLKARADKAEQENARIKARLDQIEAMLKSKSTEP